jgi:hypothetical protein
VRAVVKFVYFVRAVVKFVYFVRAVVKFVYLVSFFILFFIFILKFKKSCIAFLFLLYFLNFYF